jgi:lysophospholipid acyltransferase 1/2
MKVVFDSWNIQTSIWLRRICFDRLPTLKTIGVFVLSAFWHGFYPGFYISFVTASFAVYAGRGIRRKIRPLFQTNSITITIYAILTWIGTALTLRYD